jgi:hypothetical protein
MAGSNGEKAARRCPRLRPQRVFGAAMVGGLLMLSILLTPAFRGSFSGLQMPDQYNDVEELEELRSSDLARFQKRQSRVREQHTSLVAQMRLLGLRPELTPVDKQLQITKASAVQPEEGTGDRAARLSRLQQFKPIPEPKLLRSEIFQSEPQWGESRHGGFGVHLTGY